MITERDRILTAITVCCEADSESSVAKEWIVWCIWNRTRNPRRFAATMAGVCLQRYQFSEWNLDEGDRANLERVLGEGDDSPSWQAGLAAVDAVMAAIAAGEPDPTSGATNFYATVIYAPAWVLNAAFVGQQGHIRFYSNVA